MRPIILVHFTCAFHSYSYILFSDPIRGQERTTSLPQSYGPRINIYAPSSHPIPSPGVRQCASGYTPAHDIYHEQVAYYQAMAYATSGDTIALELSIGFFDKGKPNYLKVPYSPHNCYYSTNIVLFRSLRTLFAIIPHTILFSSLLQSFARKLFSSS